MKFTSCFNLFFLMCVRFGMKTRISWLTIPTGSNEKVCCASQDQGPHARNITEAGDDEDQGDWLKVQSMKPLNWPSPISWLFLHRDPSIYVTIGHHILQNINSIQYSTLPNVCYHAVLPINQKHDDNHHVLIFIGNK